MLGAAGDTDQPSVLVSAQTHSARVNQHDAMQELSQRRRREQPHAQTRDNAFVPRASILKPQHIPSRHTARGPPSTGSVLDAPAARPAAMPETHNGSPSRAKTYPPREREPSDLAPNSMQAETLLGLSLGSLGPAESEAGVNPVSLSPVPAPLPDGHPAALTIPRPSHLQYDTGEERLQHANPGVCNAVSPPPTPSTSSLVLLPICMHVGGCGCGMYDIYIYNI